MSAQFERICPTEALEEGGRLVVERGDLSILILRTDEGLFALDNKCPHRGGLFSEGEYEKGHIFCPLHAWCFEVRTGMGHFPRGASIRVFPVRDHEGHVELKLASEGEPT